MKYIIQNNVEQISRELYRLSQPNQEGSVLEVFTHPITGEKALGFQVEGTPIPDTDPQEFEKDIFILVHHDANLDDIVSLTTSGNEQALRIMAEGTKIDVTGQQEPPSGYVLGGFNFTINANRFGQIKPQIFMENNGWFSEL